LNTERIPKAVEAEPVIEVEATSEPSRTIVVVDNQPRNRQYFRRIKREHDKKVDQSARAVKRGTASRTRRVGQMTNPFKLKTAVIRESFRKAGVSIHWKQEQVPKGTRGTLNAKRKAVLVARNKMIRASRKIER